MTEMSAIESMVILVSMKTLRPEVEDFWVTIGDEVTTFAELKRHILRLEPVGDRPHEDIGLYLDNGLLRDDSTSIGAVLRGKERLEVRAISGRKRPIHECITVEDSDDEPMSGPSGVRTIVTTEVIEENNLNPMVMDEEIDCEKGDHNVEGNNIEVPAFGETGDRSTQTSAPIKSRGKGRQTAAKKRKIKVDSNSAQSGANSRANTSKASNESAPTKSRVLRSQPAAGVANDTSNHKSEIGASNDEETVAMMMSAANSRLIKSRPQSAAGVAGEKSNTHKASETVAEIANTSKALDTSAATNQGHTSMINKSYDFFPVEIRELVRNTAVQSIGIGGIVSVIYGDQPLSLLVYRQWMSFRATKAVTVEGYECNDESHNHLPGEKFSFFQAQLYRYHCETFEDIWYLCGHLGCTAKYRNENGIRTHLRGNFHKEPVVMYLNTN